MTPTEFKRARKALGLSARKMAAAVGVASGRTVQRWEAGDSKVPGPVVLLVRQLLVDKGAA